MKKFKKRISIFTIAIMLMAVMIGCGSATEEEQGDNVLSDNIVLTETGEVLVVPQPTDAAVEETVVEEQEKSEQEVEVAKEVEDDSPHMQLEEPYQEQVITEEDQTEPTGSELQIVFLGDSIFDNNRDGTGVPYLTAEQCEADVYNLAIGGTSASLEPGESVWTEDWDSRALVSVVKAMRGEVPTSNFEGSRTQEILDNKNISWEDTDYFIVEYGINDFFRAVPLDNHDDYYDKHTYAGALRYAVSNLQEVAPDATIIMCGPHYAQFYNNQGQFIGDSNTLNTGYGTLFDYKGICQYVAKEYQVEFLDAYFDLGIDGYTAEEYLEDGVHLTAEGRQVYADVLAKMILNIEETKNN